MTETVEVELTPSIAQALEELEAEYGELRVQNDLQQAVHQAITGGYSAMKNQEQSSGSLLGQ